MARAKNKSKNHYQKVAFILGAVLLFFTFIVGLSNPPFPKAGPDPTGQMSPWQPGGISSGMAPIASPSFLSFGYYTNLYTDFLNRFANPSTIRPTQPNADVCVSDNQPCANGAGSCQRVKRTSCESASHGNGNDANADAWQRANKFCNELPYNLIKDSYLGEKGCYWNSAGNHYQVSAGCNSIGAEKVNGQYQYDQYGNVKYNESNCNNSTVTINGETFKACKFSMVDATKDNKPVYKCEIKKPESCDGLPQKECLYGIGLRLGCDWEEIELPSCDSDYCPIYFRAPEPTGRCYKKPLGEDRCREINNLDATDTEIKRICEAKQCRWGCRQGVSPTPNCREECYKEADGYIPSLTE